MFHLHPTTPRAARRAGGVLARALVAAGLAIGVAACSTREQPIGTGNGGLTQVLLTDAPFPYDSIAHVSIFVESIEASPSADTTPANTNWVAIATPHQAFDLLDLQNGKTATLGGAVIPAGRYHSVRMVLNTDHSSVVGRDGAAVPVQWGSSAGHPTLYALVESPIDVPANGGGDVVIDFDVGRSFLCPGTSCSGELVFSPVFRAVDRDATGSISGTVRRDTLLDGGPVLGRATITVYAGDIEQLASFVNWPVAATGRTDDAGHFTVAFLPAGKYVVRADPPRDAPLSAIVSGGVTVAAGGTTVIPDLRLPTLDTSGGGVDTTITGGGGGGGNGSGATGTVATVDISPATASLTVGDSVVFVATARDAQGNDLSGEALAWTVSDSSVVVPIAAGTRYIAVRGLAPGGATVAAIARSGARGTATVTVH